MNYCAGLMWPQVSLCLVILGGLSACGFADENDVGGAGALDAGMTEAGGTVTSPFPAYPPAPRLPGQLPDYGGFFYGMNYAWHHFGGDFGGVAAWGQRGVHANPAVYREELRLMRDHGIRVVRWWLLPEFRGESVVFDETGAPLGLGASTIKDIQAALEVADDVGIDVMFTLFSFDNFRASRQGHLGVPITGLAPIVVEPEQRQKLLENVIRPIALAVAQSPHAARMVSWDLMNEPEWALVPSPGVAGDPPFRTGDMVDEPVSHQEMFNLFSELIPLLRQATPDVPISIGSAAAIWRNAWRGLDIDFHHFHIYDWVDEERVEGRPGRPFAYDKTPAALGLDDKPLVMGEFWLLGWDRAPFAKLVTTWKRLGYAGALSWSFSDNRLAGAPLLEGLTESLRVARALGCDGGAAGPRPCSQTSDNGWNFACGVEGFTMAHSQPPALGALGRVDWHNQDEEGGLVFHLPFAEGQGQKGSIARITDTAPLNLAGKTLTARVRLQHGADPPGAVAARLYVKGRGFILAPGPLTSLMPPNTWLTLAFELSTVPGFDASEIWEVGLEMTAADAGPSSASTAVIDFIRWQ